MFSVFKLKVGDNYGLDFLLHGLFRHFPTSEQEFKTEIKDSLQFDGNLKKNENAKIFYYSSLSLTSKLDLFRKYLVDFCPQGLNAELSAWKRHPK